MDAMSTPLTETSLAATAARHVSIAAENPATATTTQRVLWFEVLAVICVAVLPMLFSSASKVIWPEIAIQKPFAYTGWFLVLRTIWISVPLLFILQERNASFSTFGIVRPDVEKDVPAGLLVWVLGYAVCVAFWKGYFLLVVPETAGGGGLAIFHRPEGMAEILLLLVASLGNGFAEELVFRGYLMTRLEQLLGSVASLYVATALFAAVHVYQGFGGMVTTALLGLVYGSAFFYFRRLWPIALAHAIADFLGLVGLPG